MAIEYCLLVTRLQQIGRDPAACVVAPPDRVRSVVRQYEDSYVNAPSSAGRTPAAGCHLESPRSPSGSVGPGRMTSGTRAAAGDGPAGRCCGGCRSRQRSGPAPSAVVEADGILRFSRTSLASIAASGAEAWAKRGQRNATVNARAGSADAASLDVVGNAGVALPERVLPMVLSSVVIELRRQIVGEKRNGANRFGSP